jgi:hypothetical protein
LEWGALRSVPLETFARSGQNGMNTGVGGDLFPARSRATSVSQANKSSFVAES